MAQHFEAENTFVSAGEIPPPAVRTFLKIHYVFPGENGGGDAEPEGSAHETTAYWEPDQQKLYFRRKQHERDIREAQWFRLSEVVISHTHEKIGKILSEEYFSVEIEEIKP